MAIGNYHHPRNLEIFLYSGARPQVGYKENCPRLDHTRLIDCQSGCLDMGEGFAMEI